VSQAQDQYRNIFSHRAYKVILHDDDHTIMNDVVLALLCTLFNYSEQIAWDVIRGRFRGPTDLAKQYAENIMLTAHYEGLATVTVCPGEIAQYYQQRLQSYGLTITIEPA
jgi:ATP-dependent Clp protease adaptor protein ClpS